MVVFRCLYIAHSYLLTKRWKEATAIYERVVVYAEQAIELYQQAPSNKVRSSLIVHVALLTKHFKSEFIFFVRNKYPRFNN